jgi:uroporphyrinogen-III synthase
MKVVLTRERPRNDTLRKILELAIDVAEVPATETAYFPVADVVAACELVPRTIIVTSSRGADVAAALAKATSPDTVIAVGATTAARLAELGLRDVQVAIDEGARGVAALTFAGPVVTIGAATTRPELGAIIRERGLQFQHLSAYETRARTLTDVEVGAITTADFIVVAAPSAWSVVGPHVASTTTVVVRGQTTFEAVSADHSHVVIAPSDTDTVAAILTRALGE